jgi:hypothetical protein
MSEQVKFKGIVSRDCVSTVGVSLSLINLARKVLHL